MEHKIEFVVFCIENVARKLHMDASVVYSLLTEQTDLLMNYIIPNYDVLHSQGKEYIVEDIIGAMREDGVIT